MRALHNTHMAKPIRCGNGWRIKWTDHLGVRRSKCYLGHAEAKAALDRNQFETYEIKVGRRPPPQEQRTFAEAAAHWQEHVANREKRSAKNDESVIRKHLLPMFGNYLLSEICQTHVDEYIKSRPKLSSKTHHNHITLLISILKMAARLRWLPFTPEIKKPRIQRQRQDICFLTEPEIAKLFNAAEKHSEQLYFMYQFAVYTGLRAGEIAGLKWSDLENNVIKVQRSYNGPTKSNKTRYVPIPEHFREAVINARKHSTSEWVFPNNVGNMHQRAARVFQEGFQKVVALSGIKQTRENNRYRITFHSLRHTYATQSIRHGINIHNLKNYMGHASVTTTEIYVRLIPNLETIASPLPSFDKPSGGNVVALKSGSTERQSGL